MSDALKIEDSNGPPGTVESTPAAPTESIEAFEARVSSTGYNAQELAVLQDKLDSKPEPMLTDGDEVEGDEVEEQAPEVKAEEPAQAKPLDISDYLAAQTEIQKRQADLLERLAEAKKETPKVELSEADKARELIASYELLLRDKNEAARVMQTEDIGLDPTSRRDFALFHAMVDREIAKEQKKLEQSEKDARIAALESKLASWESAAKMRSMASRAEAEWTKATADFAPLDPELADSLKSGIGQLMQEGHDPAKAVQAVLKPFVKLLPKKAAATAQKDPNAIRALAAAAIVGKGANKTLNPFKRGTTTTASLDAFEDEFFGTRN